MKDADSENRGRNQTKKKNDQGGFMAVLHSLEEKFYGPDSPLPPLAKVALYFRHRALRDWTKRKQIPKSEISKATGVVDSQLKRALRSLEKEKFILVTRIKVGKVWSDNVYELHPDRFGNDYVYRPEKPSFKVIYGSKGHKSNPSKDLSTAGSELSTNDKEHENLGTQSTLGVGSNMTLDVGTQSTLGNDVKNSKSLENSSYKNPLKEPIKRTLSEEDSDLNNSGEKERALAAIHKIVGMGMRSIP